MRILITEHGTKVLVAIERAYQTDEDTAIAIPKLSRKFITGSDTHLLFQSLLQNGYADLSGYRTLRHSEEVLL